MKQRLADRRTHAARMRAWLRSRIWELRYLSDEELERRMTARAEKTRAMLAARPILYEGRRLHIEVLG